MDCKGQSQYNPWLLLLVVLEKGDGCDAYADVVIERNPDENADVREYMVYHDEAADKADCP